MKERIVSIQLMRALACLLVLITHLFTFNTTTENVITGSIGVDIFFVISGFIIASSVERISVEQPFKTFVINRFSRVVPYYYLITGAFILVDFILNRGLPNWKWLVQSLLFLPQGHDPVQPVGWTLNHEVFFYAFVSLSLLFTRNMKYIAAAFLGFFLAVQLIPNKYLFFKQMQATINLDFLLGILIYIFRDALLPRFRSLIWLGIGVLLLTALMLYTVEWPVNEYLKSIQPPNAYYRDTVYFWRSSLTAPRGLLYGLPCALLFLTVVAQEPRLAHFKSSNILLRIGNASFTLYLIQHLFFLLMFYFNASNLLIIVGVGVAITAASLYVFKLEGIVARETKRLVSAIW